MSKQQLLFLKMADSGDEEKVAIQLSLNEGYPFRHALAMAKALYNDLVIRFTPTEIYFKRAVSDVTYFFVIRGEDAYDYQYNVTNKAGKLVTEGIDVGVNTKDFSKYIKLIGRKEGYNMWISQKFNLIYSQVLKPGTTRNSVGIVNIIKITDVNPVYPCYSTWSILKNPMCKIPIGELATACNNICADRHSHVKLTFIGRGFSLENISPTASGRYEQLGDTNSRADHKLVLESKSKILDRLTLPLASSTVETKNTPPNGKVKPRPKYNIVTEVRPELSVRYSIIKALSRATNLSSPGTLVKVVWEPGKPLHLLFKVASYGTLSMYIRGDEKYK